MLVDAMLVVGQVRAVGAAHFAQHGAGARHDVGDAEGAADFHQFATRDDHFLALRQRVEHQQHGGRVVVDDGGRFGPRQFAQQFLDQVVAVAPLARFQVEFQVHRPLQRFHHGLHGGVRQQCPAQVGVQHRARQVEDGAQMRARLRLQAFTRLRDDGGDRCALLAAFTKPCARQHGGAQFGQHGARAGQGLHAAILRDQFQASRVAQYAVYRWQAHGLPRRHDCCSALLPSHSNGLPLARW
ncbi:hypothetical protein JaAD80_13990 [Janthinobacterium sp. AD80]|nr:hypothetical protein JaAD80_13990 [Janthinobacterium sp. AD80]